MYLSGMIGVAALVVGVPLTVMSIVVMPWQTVPLLVLAGVFAWALYRRRNARVKLRRDLMRADFDEIGKRYAHWLERIPSEEPEEPAGGMSVAERRDLHRVARLKVEGRVPWVPSATERVILPQRLPRQDRVDLTAWDDPEDDPDYEGD